MALLDILEKRRAEYRQNMERNLFWDYLLYSSAYDYRLLRFIANLPVGFGISVLMYKFVIGRLEVAEWSPDYATGFKWFLITIVAVVFAWSPVFRCSSLLSLFGACTKQGQGLLTLLVLTNLVDGPLNNMVLNFETSADSILCNVALASDIAAERVKLKLKPTLQVLVDIAAGSAESKRVVNFLDEIFAPFESEIQESFEDYELKEIRDRYGHVRKESTESPTESKRERFYNRFKSRGAAKFGEKIEVRCEDIFDEAFLVCFDNTGDIESECYDLMPWYMIPFTCWTFDSRKYCDPLTNPEKRSSMCNDEELEQQTMDVEMDDVMNNADNLTAELSAEMLMNVHFQLVQQPRLLKLASVSDIRVALHGRLGWIKSVVGIVSSLLRTLLVLLVYRVFSKSHNYTHSFLTDVTFQNNFLTNYFFRIDARRVRRVMPLRKWEVHKSALRKPLSLPSKQELATMWRPFVKWCIVAIICGVMLLQDYLLYEMMQMLNEYGYTKGESKGVHEVHLSVHGIGFMAKLMRHIMHEFNVSQKIDHPFDNSHCLPKPSAPDWENAAISIMTPMIIMLSIQVILSFALMRARLFWVAGYIFHRRQKARILYLYNMLVDQRLQFERLARARIRYQARKKLHRDLTRKARRWFAAGWLTKLLEKIGLKKQKCLLCGDKTKYSKVDWCPAAGCHVPYCHQCWLDLKKKCYACEAKLGLVTTTYSQIFAKPSPGGETNV